MVIYRITNSAYHIWSFSASCLACCTFIPEFELGDSLFTVKARGIVKGGSAHVSYIG